MLIENIFTHASPSPSARLLHTPEFLSLEEMQTVGFDGSVGGWCVSAYVLPIAAKKANPVTEMANFLFDIALNF